MFPLLPLIYFALSSLRVALTPADELVIQQQLVVRDSVLSLSELGNMILTELLLRLPSLSLASTVTPYDFVLTLHRLTMDLGVWPQRTANNDFLKRLRQARRLGYKYVSTPLGPLALLEVLHIGDQAVCNLGLLRLGVAVHEVIVKSTIDLPLFNNEVRALSMLKHERILPLLFAGNSGGRGYIVTEPMVAPLTRLINGLNPEFHFDKLSGALRVFRDILKGIQHIHRNGWLHRNLTPCNILVTKFDRVVLADFAHALRITPGTTLFVDPLASHFVPSPSYTSPESITGEWSTASDVYSACAILYKIITGSAPVPEEFGDDMYIPAAFAEAFWSKHSWPDIQMLQDMLIAGLALDPSHRPTPSQLIEKVNKIMINGEGSDHDRDDIIDDYDVIERDEAPKHWIGYPDAEREAKVFKPSIKNRARAKIGKAAQGLKSVKAVFRRHG
ncbi:hypothetical protein Q8F55_007611 [Vanrija albida]|uniref:Protein kinase domain-containing protein n=1 Tax=Vanrija albida TaxID=181172 RepID=A0ABR3PUB0_9TREE